jgi:hypothetical protein
MVRRREVERIVIRQTIGATGHPRRAASALLHRDGNASANDKTRSVATAVHRGPKYRGALRIVDEGVAFVSD